MVKTTFETRVCVHYNLHAARQNKPAWVISEYKSPRTKGRVIEYREELCLRNVRTVVQEGSRQTVIAKKCRSVHAWVTGEIVPCDSVGDPHPDFVAARYDPYDSGSFQCAGNDFSSADFACFNRHGMHVIRPSK